MAFFVWKDEYSTGITGIDTQHKEIIRLMNEVFNAISKSKEKLVKKEVFIDLLKYANYHFGLELSLFQQYHYERENEHREEHNFFIKKIETLMINDYLTDKNVLIETLHFLRSWFENHILKTDVEYCRYFDHEELMDEIEKFIKSKGDYYIQPL